jgi:hypothetical protein
MFDSSGAVAAELQGKNAKQHCKPWNWQPAKMSLLFRS